MTKEVYDALLICILAAEDSDSLSVTEDARKARDWLEKQEWVDD